MMKSKILETYPLSEYPEAKYLTENSPVIYIADFSERTKGDRGVEVYTESPLTPDGAQTMDCLTLTNEKQLNIDFSIFDDHQFKQEGKDKDDSHCECCFFLSNSDENSWISFVEIKDCKPKNVLSYKEKVKEQIISTVSHFKKKEIIAEGKRIYGIISFPRRNKVAFNDYIFRTHQEILEMRKEYGILFLPSNTIKVTSKSVAL